MPSPPKTAVDPKMPHHRVRVYFAEHTFTDSIRGRDRADALANARWNWITATRYERAYRIDYLGLASR